MFNPNGVSTLALEEVAVDKRALASNIVDLPDCSDADLNIKSEIVNRFPLVTWLLNTTLTRSVRQSMRENGLSTVHKDCDGNWVIDMPREIWSEIPEGTGEECCWQVPDFAKCGGQVPLKLLCLKDCDNIMDELMGENVTFGKSIPGLAGANETLNNIKRRIARLSMAFYSAYTIILGEDDTYTNILKPFHGLMQVMENPAIAVVNGTNILQAFESVACRAALLGYGNFVFALNPLTYQGLLNAVVRSQYGEYPMGWSRNGDVVSYRGMTFIQDRLVPVDVEAGTGEIWVLNTESVGLYLGTDLMPSDSWTRTSGHKEESRADGCASECYYYYNIGAVLGNNANKLMRIVDVPLSGACTAAIGDLASLIVPQTLIPAV